MLLDSTPVLYLQTNTRDLTFGALQAIKATKTLSISMASVWELEIKRGLGKIVLPPHLWETFADNGVEFLSIEIEDARIAGSLPLHHRDPFDRMIIAQAIRRNLPIATRDRKFAEYGVPVIWA